MHVVVVVGPPCFSLTLCDFCGHVEMECVGFLGCVGLFSGVPSINTFSRLEEVPMFVRGCCVLESFNPFDGLGCGLFCSVESTCSSMSTFGDVIFIILDSPK